MSENEQHEYDEQFVAGLEWMWGEGFLSPGGAEEVAAILHDLEIDGCHVLDIGCGIGGVDLLLVTKHGAERVTGVDVERPLLQRAQTLVETAQLTDQIDFELIKPGPLPFEDDKFGVVFSKDAMIHIPDKQAIYSEIYRVLIPNGWMAVSDWFRADAPPTPEFEAWLEVVGLSFEMGTLEEAAALLKAIGFVDIEMVDRNAWYAENILFELGTLQGENFEKLAAKMGRPFAEQRLKSSMMKKTAVDQGQLRPGHIRARKPDL